MGATSGGKIPTVALNHVARGSYELAEKYLAEACALYARWGASAKVSHLLAECAASDHRTRLSGT